MTGHSGGGEMDLAKALERAKAAKGHHDSMGKYHQDLVKWSKNVDKRYAWVVMIALWIVMGASLGPFRIYGLIYAKVTSEGIYTREQASWPVSSIFTTENVLGPLVSIVCYYIPLRYSMLIGGILLALGNLLAYFSDSLLVDIITIGIVQGIGYAFIFMPYMELINCYFLKYRNIATGFCLCGGTMSVFFLAPLMQWMLNNFPWRCAYLQMAAFSCFIILSVPFLKPNPKPTQPANYMARLRNDQTNRTKKSTTLSRMSFRALSFQHSHRRQSTILITRDMSPLDRQGSIISVNPFASSAGLERKISRSINEDAMQKPQNQSQQIFNQPGSQKPLSRQPTQLSTLTHLDDSYETKSLSEFGQDSENEFEFKLIWDILKMPGFHLIWYLELIYFWVFTIICLVLVDFAIDHDCTPEEAEKLLSFQSIGEMLGRMGLTILVDMHFISNRNVVILNLGLCSVLLVAFTQVTGFALIATLTIAINAFASLLYILLNGLLVEFLGERQVTIGYGMASFVTGVLITFRPQALGYFRDTLGSYDLLMISLAGSCALGALLCILESFWTRCTEKKGHQDDGGSIA